MSGASLVSSLLDSEALEDAVDISEDPVERNDDPEEVITESGKESLGGGKADVEAVVCRENFLRRQMTGAHGLVVKTATAGQ